MSITTKVGDRGTTFLFSGEEVSKDCARTNAYGDVDELVSVLGVARAQSAKVDIRETIFWIQCELFVVAAELATETDAINLIKERIDEARLGQLDQRRDALELKIKMPTGFIIPGGTPVAAVIDHARTVARRCERRAVGLHNEGLIHNAHLLVWLNRLSDFLWLLARYDEGNATVLKP